MKTKQKKAAGYQTLLGVRELTPAISWDKLDAAAPASVPPEVASAKPGDPDWVSYKFKFTTTAPPIKSAEDASRENLAEYVGFGRNGYSPDDTDYIIRGLLIAEIKRLRSEQSRLKHLVEEYLTAQQKEKV